MSNFNDDYDVYVATPRVAHKAVLSDKYRQDIIDELVDDFGLSRDFLADKTVEELQDIMGEVE